MVVYPKMVSSTYATIRVLREVLRCRLPIEIWFRPEEMRKVTASIDPLHQLAANDAIGGITFREISDPLAVEFATKVFAIYHSAFDRVLFLDSDNVPVRDPSFLFQTPEFVETGAVFWPDFWHPQYTLFYLGEDSLLWELLEMPFVDMFEQESGQLLIDRRRHAAPLELLHLSPTESICAAQARVGRQGPVPLGMAEAKGPLPHDPEFAGCSRESCQWIFLRYDDGAARCRRRGSVPASQLAQTDWRPNTQPS